MKQIRSGLNVDRRTDDFLVKVLLLATGVLAGYALASSRPSRETPRGTVELRYDSETGWFEVWENGVLTAEWTATELGIETVPDPHGWQQRFFWVAIDEVKPPCHGSMKSSTPRATRRRVTVPNSHLAAVAVTREGIR